MWYASTGFPAQHAPVWKRYGCVSVESDRVLHGVAGRVRAATFAILDSVRSEDEEEACIDRDQDGWEQQGCRETKGRVRASGGGADK